MTMAARFNGQVFVPDEPVELPVGRKVRVEVEPIHGFDDDPDPPGAEGAPQPNDPEPILHPYMSPERKADWLAYRKKQNELHESKMDALIKRINECTQ